MNYKVVVLPDAVVYLSGLSFDEYYLDASAFGRFWERGVKPLKLIFNGDSDHVDLPGVSCPHISYGHVAALGAHINYPIDSEPNVERMFDGLDEGIGWLHRDFDYSDNALFRHCVKYTETLGNYFPDREIKIGGLGLEGPVTTAVLLRGQDFYVDMHENPDGAKKFLELITDSIISYRRFLRKINGEPEIGADGTGLADDFAALVNPDMFEEFVIPYWNRYYEGLISGGRRSLHCEGLDRKHLKLLKKADIGHFDPTVSKKLTCRMLAEELAIPYCWMLPSFEIAWMDKGEIESWACETASHGPDFIFTELDRMLMRSNGIEKMRQFLSAMGASGPTIA